MPLEQKPSPLKEYVCQAIVLTEELLDPNRLAKNTVFDENLNGPTPAIHPPPPEIRPWLKAYHPSLSLKNPLIRAAISWRGFRWHWGGCWAP